ncbi:MAG: CDP-alcohol phosphatidyltransferase family protein [Deltaproteobacteria bacterium]
MRAALRKERFDQARLINIANGLTALRVLLVPVVAYLLIAGRFRLALLVFAVCGISDSLDGVLARWLKQRTVVGFYLDPVADKLLMAMSFIVLAIVNVIPVWLTVLVISRDIFILAGSFLILILIGTEGIRVTAVSKANTVMQIATVLYFLSVRAFPGALDAVRPGVETVATEAVIILCAATTALSGIQYLIAGIGRLSRA